ncbi:uncharacterized protein LOC132792260 [Drosophila nasuta]|uniref:uncharacterized protein LOC132792260 n=1 Tax=Drosophila nasuta TaxID=42062 RepID=UPI00295E97B8|nr:uncharacterized protein LOC132792260 [Drosophila nasuta]
MPQIARPLSTGWKCLLARKYDVIPFNKAFFHRSNKLSRKDTGSPRDPMDCPKTKTTECLTLKKRKCSPTDPPVRPCSEKDCEQQPKISCCRNTSLSKDVCQPSSYKDKKKTHKWESMWESTPMNMKTETALMWDYPAECCPKCDDVRFDVLYYRPSTKKQEYQRTWWECCPRMVPKRVCCYCDAIPPEKTRRCLPLCPRTACNQDHEAKRLKCLNDKSKDCMRLTMPCCRAARVPPVCNIVRRPLDCTKTKCPFPSYSECQQMEAANIPQRPPQCRCLDPPSQCDSVRAKANMTHEQLRMCPCPKCP